MSTDKIILNQAPQSWPQGLPLGCGEAGAMVWSSGRQLNFTLDHLDAWEMTVDESGSDDPRFNYQELRRLVKEKKEDEIRQVFMMRWLKDNPVGPTKVNLGRFELGFADDFPARAAWTLDMRNAEITIDSGAGRRALAFFSRACGSLLVQGENLDFADMNLIAFEALCPTYRGLNLPPTRIERETDSLVAVQTLTGKCFIVAARRHGDFISVTVADGDCEAAAREKLCRRESYIQANGFSAIRREHRREWRQFWQKSDVSVPDDFAQRAWYSGLYEFHSCVAPGLPPPALLGVWSPDGMIAGWRGEYAADMNVQQAFFMGAVSNHVELLDSYLDYWIDNYDKARAFTEKFFGGQGIFCLTALLKDMVPLYSWPTVQYAWQGGGFIGLMFYHRWKISDDQEWLRKKGYPFIAGVFDFYESHLEMGSDGFYHVPLSASPEYNNDYITAWAEDPNIDLALIRKICDFIREMEAELGVAERSERALEIRRKLAPYAYMAYSNRNYEVDLKKVLALWPGQLMEESHRHPSHMMAIYPALDITLEDGEEACAVIHDSYKHYLAMGQHFWCGHTYSQMISFAAVLRKPEHALNFLHKVSCWIAANGMHYHRDLSNCGDWHFSDEAAPESIFLETVDVQGGIVEGINTMLLQSHRGILRIFPAVPKAWRHRVGFRSLGAEGGLLVSAEMHDNQVAYVKIAGRPGRLVKLVDPFGGRDFTTDARCHRSADGLLWTLTIPESGILSLTAGAAGNERIFD